MLKFIIFFLFMTVQLFAVSDQQLKVLQSVRDVARTIADRHGETYENTLSAICLTESSAGRDLIGDFDKGVPITKASLGVMQIQVATARYMSTKSERLRWLDDLSDAQLANRLISDVQLSARIAAEYLVLLKNSRERYFNVVSGYNGGFSNPEYYRRVMRNMQLVKKLVKQGKIS